MSTVSIDQTDTDPYHTPGEDTLGGCLRRMWTACRVCGAHVVFCHLPDRDVRLAAVGLWAHPECVS